MLSSRLASAGRTRNMLRATPASRSCPCVLSDAPRLSVHSIPPGGYRPPTRRDDAGHAARRSRLTASCGECAAHCMMSYQKDPKPRYKNPQTHTFHTVAMHYPLESLSARRADAQRGAPGLAERPAVRGAPPRIGPIAAPWRCGVCAAGCETYFAKLTPVHSTNEAQEGKSECVGDLVSS